MPASLECAPRNQLPDEVCTDGTTVRKGDVLSPLVAGADLPGPQPDPAGPRHQVLHGAVPHTPQDPQHLGDGADPGGAVPGGYLPGGGADRDGDVLGLREL